MSELILKAAVGGLIVSVFVLPVLVALVAFRLIAGW